MNISQSQRLMKHKRHLWSLHSQFLCDSFFTAVVLFLIPATRGTLGSCYIKSVVLSSALQSDVALVSSLSSSVVKSNNHTFFEERMCLSWLSKDGSQKQVRCSLQNWKSANHIGWKLKPCSERHMAFPHPNKLEHYITFSLLCYINMFDLQLP